MTLSRRAALGGLGMPLAGALVSAPAAAAGSTVPPSDPVSPEQFGAAGDGRSDDWSALTRCLAFAKRRSATVRLASRSYAVGRTLVVPSGVVVTGGGCGRADEGVGSELLALASGMLVARMESQARLASLSIQCAGRARAGLLVQGARPSLADVQVYDAAEHAFILDQCQNGTFVNICARGARSCFCLLNGARNNSFFNATAAAVSARGDPPLADTAIWTLMIDVTDPWRWGTSAGVVSMGNDQNRVFGGIFEAARFGIRPHNPHGYRDNWALLGTTMFTGCPEFTVGSLLDSSGQPEWDGTLVFPDGITFIGADDRTPMTMGEAGRLVFGGIVSMTGAHDMPWRGIACAHNLAERSYARQSLLGPRDVARPRATGIAAAVFPAALLEGAWARRDPISGDIVVDVLDAASDHAGILIGLGGDFAPGQPANARGGLLRLSFAISGLADHEAVALYVAAPAPVFRRRLAPAGISLVPGAGELRNGVHQFAYRLGADETPAFTLARGTARTRFVLSGFEMVFV